ncbi:MAG TPA: hypothetical protein VGM54_07490 [Chthoniobacter sp.]|jgi:hypothetical protein
MNPTTPPAPRQRHGCLIVLALFTALFIVAVLVVYHLVMRTPMPYRIIASAIEKANPAVKITGITGNLSSGIGIESIAWGDDPQKRSEILGLQIKFAATADRSGKYRLVVHDVGVRKAHVDLADFGPASGSSSSTSSSPSPTNPQTMLESLDVERVSIEDVLITDRASSFRLSIPKIEWTGFKWTPTSLEPGTLLVESDRLTIHTIPGRTVSLNGRKVTFQKSFTGTALPALHPAVKQAIPFIADVGYPAQGQIRGCHVEIADGKLEWETTEDGGGSLHVRKLDLPSYIDARKLFGEKAADLPSDLVLSAVATSGFTDGHGTINITGGNFRLGAATFQIEPEEFGAPEQSSATLRAVFTSDAGKIEWSLPLANLGHEFQPRFSSPSLSPEEILAHVFFAKAAQDLSPEEKKEVDSKRSIYFPLPEQ